MARPTLTEENLLQISIRCAQTLAEAGIDASTSQLLEGSGMSERTFFRYFPTKAECIRPYLESGMKSFVSKVEVLCQEYSSFEPLRELVHRAFVSAMVDDPAHMDRRFLSALLDSAAYRRVWLEINHDTVDSLVGPLAQALGVAPDSFTAQIAASEATLFAVTTIRQMVHTGLPVTEVAAAVNAELTASPLSRTITA